MTTVNPDQTVNLDQLVNPDQLAESIFDGAAITEAEALALLSTPDEDLFSLVSTLR